MNRSCEYQIEDDKWNCIAAYKNKLWELWHDGEDWHDDQSARHVKDAQPHREAHLKVWLPYGQWRWSIVKPKNLRLMIFMLCYIMDLTSFLWTSSRSRNYLIHYLCWQWSKVNESGALVRSPSSTSPEQQMAATRWYTMYSGGTNSSELTAQFSESWTARRSTQPAHPLTAVRHTQEGPTRCDVQPRNCWTRKICVSELKLGS